MQSKSLTISYLTDNSVEISLSGDWCLTCEVVTWQSFQAQFEQYPESPEKIDFVSSDLENWDSKLLLFLVKLDAYAQSRHIPVNWDGLPDGAKGLLRLATEVPERSGARRRTRTRSLVYRLGTWAMGGVEELTGLATFLGEWLLSIGRFFTGRASFRWVDFNRFLQAAGAGALPIVGVISLLVGAVLAFVGAVQLQMFGAQIYVADLVGLGVVREMGAMMTAIIMAGRTGSAYAAQLGTMQVNEEIDALRTMGISPMDFLVLPRTLALILMLPLLCLWSDALGILGGLLVGVSILDITLLEYLQQTKEAITLTDIATGLIKSLIFAVVVSLSGCLRGLQSGRNSAAVGNATTSAMVTAILLIVIWDALTTIIFNRLGI